MVALLVGLHQIIQGHEQQVYVIFFAVGLPLLEFPLVLVRLASFGGSGVVLCVRECSLVAIIVVLSGLFVGTRPPLRSRGFRVAHTRSH